MRIGILGGSFNPPHHGHLHISLTALKMLRLDCLWWLVTPQNPLKKNLEMMAYEERLDRCQALTAMHPHILVTDIEQQMNLRYSYDTVCYLRDTFPHTDFVMLTGMDNALSFHLWRNWRDILDVMATAHIARPPFWAMVESCPLKGLRTQNHHILDKAFSADLSPHNSYWLLHTPRVDISSSEIRKNHK